MILERPSTRRQFKPLFISLIVAYLFVFSAFALYHAYAENELFNAHECAIGDWVHHGHAVLAFVAALSAFLRIVLREQAVRQDLPQAAVRTLDFSRGPPFPAHAS